jgi:hypothetical protein
MIMNWGDQEWSPQGQQKNENRQPRK